MSIIKRYLEPEELFKASLDDFKNIYKSIRTASLKPNADFWDMQFRKKNTVTLYYKSCAYNFQLKNYKEVNETQYAYKFKLNVSESLKKYLIKAVEDESKLEFEEKKDLIDNINKGGICNKECSLSDFFEKYKGVFETAVNKSHYGEDKNNKERKVQQYLAVALENSDNLIMLDYEVVLENIGEDINNISSTKLCRSHNKYNSGDYENYREIDLLLLKKGLEGKYKFIPVELKMSGSTEDGICQVSTYANMIKKYISSFSENYLKVIEQKNKIGILNDKFKIIKAEHIDTNLVDEVYIGVIFNNSISYENAENKCSQIGERSLNRQEYLSGKNLKIIPIILSENDEENRESINNFIKEIQ